jgi:hypothetical protein
VAKTPIRAQGSRQRYSIVFFSYQSFPGGKSVPEAEPPDIYFFLNQLKAISVDTLLKSPKKIRSYQNWANVN